MTTLPKPPRSVARGLDSDSAHEESQEAGIVDGITIWPSGLVPLKNVFAPKTYAADPVQTATDASVLKDKFTGAPTKHLWKRHT